MTDTIRALATLQTNLADNSSGAITPQTVRDMLVSTFVGTYAGSPNGNVAGVFQGQLIWDTTNNQLWLCKTTGSSGSAVWVNTGLSLAPVNPQSGTTYTIAATDAGAIVTFSNGSATTITVPNSLPIGFGCYCLQIGAGQLTYSAGSGATVNNRSTNTKSAGQYGAQSLVCYSNSNGTSAIVTLAGDTA